MITNGRHVTLMTEEEVEARLAELRREWAELDEPRAPWGARFRAWVKSWRWG